MNEVTKIHLGRMAFTASIDAYSELRAYLDAIAKQVDDTGVVEEIEMRMAELLVEHGITDSRVILSKDVKMLKQQLGSPRDFKDEDDDEPASDESSYKTRRLFRDTDNAIVAGVASGLAKYFGLEVLLVRILFVILVIVTFGWGILLYILFWILVPEAKTPSDKLQMAGRRVTVNSLKQVIEDADIKGAAKRANHSIVDFLNSVFRLVVKLFGIAFITLGLSAVLFLVAMLTYYVARGSSWAQNNIFPVGLRENLLFGLALGTIALMAVFVVLFGIALFKREWPIKTWITGLLAGLVFIGLATSGALIGDVYPTIRTAFDANNHTSYRSLSSFTSVEATGFAPINVNFAIANKYYVAINYYAKPNIGNIKTSVKNGVLDIDYTNFNWQRNCSTLCIPNNYETSIMVYSPNAMQLTNQGVNQVKPIQGWINP